LPLHEVDHGHHPKHWRLRACQRREASLGACGGKSPIHDADAADPTPARVTVEAALEAFIAKFGASVFELVEDNLNTLPMRLTDPHRRRWVVGQFP